MNFGMCSAVIGNDVRDDPHGGCRGIDIGVPDHKLLQDVILQCPGQLRPGHPLLLRGHDKHGHDRDHRPIHGHGYRHPVKRDPMKQDFHILHRINGNPGLSHIAFDTGMIRVVPPVGCKIKGHRQTGLSTLNIPAVECIGFFRSGKSGILPDRPGSSHIHGGFRPPGKRGHSGHGVNPGNALKITGRVKRFDINPFRRSPVNTFQGFPL